MEFTNLDYKRVEEALLNGSKLNSLQREFIELFETKTIVAGPGTGKTTSLAAKIALMMIEMRRTNEEYGICIITHTNVAVNEINIALQRVGVGKIKHPHFIGTINEFFNKFCVLPFFKLAFKTNSLSFPDQNKEDHNNIDAYISMISKQQPWMNEGVKSAIARRIDNSHLILNNNKLDLENTTNWDKFYKYRQMMLGCKLKRKSQGFITHEDTFFFSDISLLNNRMVEILRERFKYVFIDEFQDTNLKGEKLLDKLFKTNNNVIQKIGDPYQTIGFTQSIPYIKEEDIFRLNLSNRFGGLIGNHLNIIVPEAQIETDIKNNSFNPILLVFNNPYSVDKAYYNMINKLSKDSPEFNDCNKRDSILVLRKETTNEYFNIKYKEDKKKKRASTVSELKKLIIHFIHKKIMEVEIEGSLEIKNWIGSHKSIQSIYLILINILKTGLSQTLKTQLSKEINSILQDKLVGKIGPNDIVFSQIQEIVNDNIEVKHLNQIENQISTIHSVKGETHRSVLLLDFEEKPLTKILMSKYVSASTENIDIINRNILYVAMSRAMHLFVFAISEDNLTDDIVTMFNRQNWDIQYAQELI